MERSGVSEMGATALVETLSASDVGSMSEVRCTTTPAPDLVPVVSVLIATGAIAVPSATASRAIACP